MTPVLLLVSALLSIVVAAGTYAALMIHSPHSWWSALTMATLLGCTCMIACGAWLRGVR
jgi:hypothetical protein